MDLLIKLSMEAIHNCAEFLVSFKPGQVVLRHMDKALWVVEKTAKWAVPPPLDQDESAQQELVRPLPWLFFLSLLVTLRVTRESISLINLVLGKPPLRSADVVTFIQSKRRYLRTLKYQGTRQMRARASTHQEQQSWFPRLQKMFELSMCFKSSPNNNNVRDNEEVMVVKRKRREAPRQGMERLIEKMMVDLNTDTDDDSSYTLTNATSMKSDTDISETEQDTIVSNDISTTPSPPPKQTFTSTPKKNDGNTNEQLNESQEKPSKIPKSNVANSKSDHENKPEHHEDKYHVANSKLEHEEKKNGNDSGATDLNATCESFYEVQPEQVTEIPKSNDISHKTKLGTKILMFFTPRFKVESQHVTRSVFSRIKKSFKRRKCAAI